jgi:hypothetical protein
MIKKAVQMKTCGIFFFFALGLTLFGTGLTAHAQTSQGVGINTSQPAGAFHVKTANGKDVVVEHGTGNLGIHTTTPQAKADVNGSVRIIDGLEQAGHILTSDDNGNARWNNPVGVAGKLMGVLKLGVQDIPSGSFEDVVNSRHTADADGYHVYEIRWHATYASKPPREMNTATHFRLMLHSAATGKDTIADQFEVYHDITRIDNDAVTFWINLSTYAKAGDELSLTVCPTIAHADLLLRKDSERTTAKIIVKRLNMQ